MDEGEVPEAERTARTTWTLVSAGSVVLTLVTAGSLLATPSLRPRLSTFWDEWQEEVGLIMSEREAAYFEALEDSAARDAFEAAFWESRGAAAVARWARNQRAVEQLRPRSAWERRALLLFGKPASIERTEACGGLRPMQIWRWEPWSIARQGGRSERAATLILLQESRLLPASYRPWDPDAVADLGYTGSSATDIGTYLERVRPARCVGSSVRRALEDAVSFAGLREVMPWPRPDTRWLDELSERATEPATDSPVDLEIAYTGSQGRHTILRGSVRLDRKALHAITPEQIFDRVTLVGDIYKRDYLVDSFEIVHHIAGSPPFESVDLDLFRGLRPGTYHLELRVFDGNGLTLLHTERELSVPRLSYPAPPIPGRRQGYANLTREEVVLLDTFPSIELLPVSPRAAVKADLVAITTGGPIADVAFYLDDELVMVDDSAPYAAEVDLSGSGHRVRATARDTDGQPLASDERAVELAPRPFTVRLSRSDSAASKIPVSVALPEGARLGRLECFDGRERVATLTAPPYACPRPERFDGGFLYVRAKATLVGGQTAEDLLFFGRSAPENVDVRLVQLLVSVFDQNGRPVAGLGEDDLRVWEAGRQLELVSLESLADLPISIAVLMDLSSSMGRLAGLAAESTQRFFERLLVDEDLASLLAFNDGFHQLVPFTADVNELRLGAEGVKALGSTRLNDSIVWALGQYAGQRNRRALVILSDGADVASDYPLEQVIDAAVDAGVVVYPVSLVRPGEQAPDRLDQLAARTGGTRYVVGSIDELDEAFRRITRELRSQYLLVYRRPEAVSVSTEGTVDIEVLRNGYTTRNIRSYYQ